MMSLPACQQRVLDRIEHSLHAGDPPPEGDVRDIHEVDQGGGNAERMTSWP
jgi:hypothetical protein